MYIAKSKYYFNKPNLNEPLIDSEYKSLYRTNNQGYRIGISTPMDKELKACDWIFLGDSFTQGAQVEFEQLYTSMLYRYFPNKIILNAGVSGFGIAEEYYLLKDLTAEIKPKKVFLQLGSFNDFVNVEIKSRSISDYIMQYSDLFRYLLYGLKYQRSDDLPLGRWTEPFHISENDNIDFNIFYNKSSPQKEADIEALKKYFVLLNQEVEKAGAELILIILPSKEQVYPRYFDEVIKTFKINIEYLDMNKPNKILTDLANSLGVRVIDLTKEYKKLPNEVFLVKDEHLNAYGHSVTADIIANKMKTEEAMNVKILGSHSMTERYPSYTKNGTKLIYQALREGKFEIMEDDIIYGTEQRVTYGGADKLHPTFSPNNELIAYTEGDPSSLRSKIAILDVTNSHKTLITNKENQFGAIPMFSSNGKLITYAQWHYDPRLTYYSLPQIVYSELNGDHETVITNNDFESWRPVFSKDSQSIFYISRRNENFDIYRYDLISHIEMNLTNTPYDEWDPSISFDGNKIVFAAHKYGNWDLFEMSIKGENIRQLTFTVGDEWDPSYSPDGSNVVFAGDFGFLGGIYEYSLNEH
ncbi:MAG: hypothetical protein Q7U10_08710 [Thermodesulfovibrionia bacterium]|nr:hypothetical protein [Thermodesulfovibrionia bacterium]